VHIAGSCRSLWKGTLLSSALWVLASHAAEPDGLPAERLLDSPTTFLIDGHNLLPLTIRTHGKEAGDIVTYDLRRQTSGQTDLRRLRDGRISAQIWSTSIPSKVDRGAARLQLEQIDLARRMIEHYPESLRLALSARDIVEARRSGKVASLLSAGGGASVEDSLGVLRSYYALGVRIMALTGESHTNWATSAAESTPNTRGLSPFGERVINEMNGLGMLVDVSGASDETMADAIRVSSAPVIFSHSGARALCDDRQNVPDAILRALKVNGGIVMVPFRIGAIGRCGVRGAQAAAGLASDSRVSVRNVADHIEHVRAVAGVEHVGIGADFEEEGGEYALGVTDVSMYPNLFTELLRRGWSEKDLKGLAGGNFLRVFTEAEKVAVNLYRYSSP
jgi:membrane dipeptidase